MVVAQEGKASVISTGPSVVPNSLQVDCDSVYETTDVSGGGIQGVLQDYGASVQSRRTGSFRKNKASAKMYGGCDGEKGVATRSPTYPESPSWSLLRVSQAVSLALLV